MADTNHDDDFSDNRTMPPRHHEVDTEIYTWKENRKPDAALNQLERKQHSTKLLQSTTRKRTQSPRKKLGLDTEQQGKIPEIRSEIQAKSETKNPPIYNGDTAQNKHLN
ncbi:10130_t:CDS:2 [Scutellospora calospora]|uniref:10130_t:CDS:1 n=1 Tax=Scutellospora calospora TaxID=85575 RepID=A0ACA9KDZ9_9GLOM|nr:10130_t:CDS:2 [Scutellospora calospora]